MNGQQIITFLFLILIQILLLLHSHFLQIEHAGRMLIDQPAGGNCTVPS